MHDLEQEKERERQRELEAVQAQEAQEEAEREAQAAAIREAERKALEAKKRQEEEIRARKEEEERAKAAQEAAIAAAKAESEKHLEGYRARSKMLKEMQSTIDSVANSTDPETKKIRIQVKKSVGEACNQISAQPSAIRLVVEKLCKLLSVC